MRVICIEGIDAVGKETVANALADKIRELGYSVKRVSFPRYETAYGRAIKETLFGSCGDASKMNPYLIGPLYTLDRIDYFKNNIDDLILNYDFLVLDRSFYSNFMYQCSKLVDGSNLNDPVSITNIYDWIIKNAQWELIDTGLCKAESISTFILNLAEEDSLKQLNNRTERDTNESNRGYLNNCKLFVENTVKNVHIKSHSAYKQSMDSEVNSPLHKLAYKYYINNVIGIDVVHEDNPELIPLAVNNTVNEILRIFKSYHPTSLKDLTILDEDFYSPINITESSVTYKHLIDYFRAVFREVNNFIKNGNSDNPNIKDIAISKFSLIIKKNSDGKITHYCTCTFTWEIFGFKNQSSIYDDLITHARSIEEEIFNRYLMKDGELTIDLSTIKKFPINFNGKYMYL